MDIRLLLSLPWFFMVGLIWLLFHIVLLVATRCLKLPFSYLAIASQCNFGGVASAPVVESAYNKALIPLAVLITVLAIMHERTLLHGRVLSGCSDYKVIIFSSICLRFIFMLVNKAICPKTNHRQLH